MPLVTFEKYLREEHGVEVRSGAGRHISLVSGRRTVLQFEDDQLSSVTGALLQHLRLIFPEAEPLMSSPLVQIVRGRSIDDMLGSLDLSDIYDEYLSIDGAAEQLDGIYDAEKYDYLCQAFLNSPSAVDKYRAADLLHDLAVRARVEDLKLMRGEVLPFNEPDEFMDVWMGVVPNKSLKAPRGFSNVMIAHFKELYPDARLSADRTELIRGGEEVRLLDVLGLPVVEPFTFTREELLRDVNPPLPGPVAPPAQNLFLGGEALVTQGPVLAQEELVEGREIEGVRAGIDHVVKYLDVDVNSLPPEEREIYAYGFPGAKKLIDKLSPKKKKDLFKNLPIGTYRDVVVITTLASALKLVIRAELSDDQWALMAGARVLVQKGGWDIEVDGEWTRRLGPL